MALMEFTSGAEMMAFYAALKAKRMGPVSSSFPPQKPKPEIVSTPKIPAIDPADLISDDPDYSPVTIEKIIRMVCLHYGITRPMLTSGRRFVLIARARQVVSFLAEHHTKLSRPAIGRHLGGLDNSTVIHGIKKISKLRVTNPMIAADIEAIMVRLFPLPVPFSFK